MLSDNDGCCQGNSAASSDSPPNLVLEAAMRLLAAGQVPIPVDTTTKQPRLKTWKRFQQSAPSPEIIRTWFRDSKFGIALICGQVSGNVEAIDFDKKAVLFDAWASLVEGQRPGLLCQLVIQRSQRGGRHVFYRCPGVQLPGSTKLAMRRDPSTGRRETLIETRGEGGYILGDPSPGYKVIQGSLASLPIIAQEERSILFECARALDEVDSRVPVAGRREGRQGPRPAGGLRPGDDYNQRGDVGPLLLKHGWALVGKIGEYAHWRRPGKSEGLSASLINGKIFYVFSTNADPFQDHKAYSPFGVYALLECGGDYVAAARKLAKQGFGTSWDHQQPGGDDMGGDGGIVAEGSSIPILVEFLKRFSPVALDKAGRIKFKDGQRVPLSGLWSLEGCLDEVARTREYAACRDKFGNVRPPTHISLAKSLFAAAGQRLLSELRLERWEEAPGSVETARRELVNYLVKPRSTSSSTGLNMSLGAWATEVKTDGWLRFGSHPVFATRQDNLEPRIAISPAFLHSEIGCLRTNLDSIESCAGFLLRCGLIQGASSPIRIGGRLVRVWVLSAELVTEACGSPDGTPEVQNGGGAAAAVTPPPAKSSDATPHSIGGV